MRLFLLPISIVLLACGSQSRVTHSSAVGNDFTISGLVQQRDSYCQGARPTQQILDQVMAPRPFPDKVFYIRKGKTNTADGEIIQSFTTDKEGLFSIKLPPGTYSIIVEEQLKEIDPKDYEKKNLKVDAQCLAEWWKKPFYQLEVKGQDIDSLAFLITHPCYTRTDIPCVNYTGPLPH